MDEIKYVILLCNKSMQDAVYLENICRGSMTDIRVRVGFRVLLFGPGRIRVS